MQYKQTSKALVVKAIFIWWWWGLILLGIPIVIDILQYKRNRLIIGEKTVLIESGILSIKSREIPIGKVQTVSVSQSALGQMFDYGHLLITSGNELVPIVFKYIDRPQVVKQMLQDKV